VYIIILIKEALRDHEVVVDFRPDTPA